MKVKGAKSKRQKLSLRYNIQKRVRETRRRLKKEAKKLGVKKKPRKDPGIPNSWPFKAEMLQELEQRKEKREKELAERKLEARQKVKDTQKQQAAEARAAAQEREAMRRAKRVAEVERSQREALNRVLERADLLLEVLDARDPIGCRCSALEAWAEQQGKRIIFVLAKADLVAPQVVAQWLQVLGSVGPAVAIQAEAGQEGIQALLQMLGHAEEPAPPDATAQAAAPAGAAPTGAALLPVSAVGIVGYANTGKRVLSRAMRRQVKGPARWLLESIGRLRPAAEPTGEVASLHAVIRALPRSANKAPAAAPLETIRQLLGRAKEATLMRRFRLPAFEGVEGFLHALAKDRSMKTRKGKEPGFEFIARRVLAELPALPGCFCAPPDVAESNALAFWPAHGAGRPVLEVAMQAQVQALSTRGAGPTVSAIMVSSAGFGPVVDLKGALPEEGPPDEEMDISSDNASEEEGDEGEEEEDGEEAEDEMMEGEEEEEEDEEGDDV